MTKKTNKFPIDFLKELEKLLIKYDVEFIDTTKVMFRNEKRIEFMFDYDKLGEPNISTWYRTTNNFKELK